MSTPPAHGEKAGKNPAAFLLHKSREFQPQPRAVGQAGCGMVVPDDLDPPRLIGLAMAMLKNETPAFPSAARKRSRAPRADRDFPPAR